MLHTNRMKNPGFVAKAEKIARTKLMKHFEARVQKRRDEFKNCTCYSRTKYLFIKEQLVLRCNKVGICRACKCVHVQSKTQNTRYYFMLCMLKCENQPLPNKVNGAFKQNIRLYTVKVNYKPFMSSQTPKKAHWILPTTMVFVHCLLNRHDNNKIERRQQHYLD